MTSTDVLGEATRGPATLWSVADHVQLPVARLFNWLALCPPVTPGLTQKAKAGKQRAFLQPNITTR